MSISAASWYRRPAEIVELIVALVPGCRDAVHNDVYRRHRERPRSVAVVPAPAAARSMAPSPVPTRDTSPPVAEVPAWTAAITDGLFRQALMHLERHGSLGEAELHGIVGGPRRGRAFAAQLEAWREHLPFVVEVGDAGGAKVYRNVGPRST